MPLLLRASRSAIAVCIAIAFGVWLMTACRFGDNTIEPVDALGPRDDIGDCCLELLKGPFGDVQACLDDRTELGVCRWLTCAKLWTYHSEACR